MAKQNEHILLEPEQKKRLQEAGDDTGTPKSVINSGGLQDVLNMVNEMMGELHNTAGMSAELYKLDITDEWANDIKEMLKTPVKTSFVAYNAIEKSIIEMLREQIENFIASKAGLVKNVYLVTENALHYAIVLKDDTIENEAALLEFKVNYDETPVSKKFPLIISFPQSGHLENAKIARELTFG